MTTSKVKRATIVWQVHNSGAKSALATDNKINHRSGYPRGTTWCQCQWCTTIAWIFTARRYAKRSICRRHVSVCLCVCRKITQITPHDSPMTLVSDTEVIREIRMGSPLWGRQMQVGWVKIRHIRRKTRYNSKTVQYGRIVSIKVE